MFISDPLNITDYEIKEIEMEGTNIKISLENENTKFRGTNLPFYLDIIIDKSEAQTINKKLNELL